MQKLPREFYNRETSRVAKDLLGHHIVHYSQGIAKIGKIVEVEAYLGPHDLAAHSSKGLTKRTVTMFGPPGYAYVYLIYGMYHCFNIVTEPSGIGAAVLIRAVEPVANITGRTMGPGLLCRAMMIDRHLNAHDLLSDDLFITDADYEPPAHIVEAPRVGVHYAKEWANKLLRFYIQGNAFVSKPKGN
ncbi:DNA-3-methyladenine glycosylase [Legionella fairfieldensis]|uniref:DNA-3-methyladenine glycosylase n=1 Tax=Legionella fairfieldensis TaxID=45064 RepID=UPI0004905FC7|nr:DNA-3-methyladenine glycosylase [Legionella fairfieldensis]